MLLPGRHANTSDYRYGYQGSMKDDELKGEGNEYATMYRQLDPRLGRWTSTDPKEKLMPWQSPYSSMDNNPVRFNDVNGDIATGIDCVVIGGITLGELILGGLAVTTVVVATSEDTREGMSDLATALHDVEIGTFESFPDLSDNSMIVRTFPAAAASASIEMEQIWAVKDNIPSFRRGMDLIPLASAATAIETIPAFEVGDLDFSILSISANDVGGFITTEPDAQSIEGINDLAERLRLNEPRDIEKLREQDINTVSVGGSTFVLDGHNRLTALAKSGLDSTLEITNLSIEKARTLFPSLMEEIENGDHDDNKTIEENIPKE